jgi:hypothetical protein
MSQMKISAGNDEGPSPRPSVAANEGRPDTVLPQPPLPSRRRSASKQNTLLLIATIFSIFWLGACASYFAMMTLSGKAMPLDVTSLAAIIAGVATPLAVIWMIALYLRHAADSRLNQALLTNPAALTSQQVSAMSASISEGAHRLTEAAEIARNRIAEIEDGMARHTSRLLDVAETAARNADYVKAQLKAQNDALVGLIKDLTSRSDQIEAIVSTATSNLFGATDQAVLKAEQAGSLLATHAATLTEATRRAESLSNGIEDTFSSSVDRIREASLEIDQAFGNSIGKMRDASRQATEEAETVGKSLAEHSLSLTVAADHAADRAGFIARRLHKEVDEIGQIADQVSARTDQISASFANQGKAITDAAADYEHLAGQINVTAEEARRRLEDETRSHAQEMQRVSELAAEKARETVKVFSDEASTLQATSDGIIENVRLAGAAFVEQSEKIDEVARDVVSRASSRVDQARVKLDEHLARLTRVTELAEALTNSLSGKFASYVDQLSAATDQASAEAEVIGTAFRSSGESLMDVTRMVGERTEEMRHVLESERDEVERVSRALRAQSHEMDESMRSHARDMAEAAERAATWADTAGKAFKHQTEEMTQSADTATHRLMEQYANHAQSVTSAAQSAVDSVIAAIEDKIRTHSMEVAWISEQAATRAEETLSGIVGETRKFAAQTDAQFVELVEHFADAVREQASAMARAAQGANETIASAGAEFKAKAGGLEDAASGITAKMAEAGDKISSLITRIGEDFAAQTGGLEQTTANLSAQVAAKLEEAKALLDQHASLLDTVSENAASKIADAGEEFSRRSTELETASKMSREFIHDTLESLRGEMSSIAQMADTIAERVKQACDELDGRDSGLKGAADQAVAHLTAAGNLLEKRSADLHEKSATAREEIARVGDLFDEKILAFARAASSTKTGLLNAGKSLDESAGELDDRSRIAAEAVKAAGEGLRHEIRLLGDESAVVLSKLSEASASVQRHMRELSSQSASRPATRTEQTPPPPLPSTAPKHTDTLAPATQSFLAGAKLTLKQAPHGAVSTMSEDSRNAVLTSAAYIVECLEAVDIDTVDVFDQRVANDFWQRYVEGEEGLMSHANALLGSRKIRALVRHRYNTDARFKSAISTYLTWFRDVIGSAQAGGRNELSAYLRLLGSDMGTLYALVFQSITLRL